jgi:hypothetical protein
MIRLPVLSADAAIVVAVDRAHWVRLLASTLAGVSPQQCDEIDDVFAWSDLCLA